MCMNGKLFRIALRDTSCPIGLLSAVVLTLLGPVTPALGMGGRHLLRKTTADSVAAVPDPASGLLWKRVDPTTEEQDARRGRELVIAANSTIGNYVYVLNYIFRQDGSLEVRVAATGETLNRGVYKVEEGDEFGTTVTTAVAAPNHQHLLNFRLDLDVDETENDVVEANISSVPSEFGNAFAVSETMLKTESEAQRDLNPASVRV